MAVGKGARLCTTNFVACGLDAALSVSALQHDQYGFAVSLSRKISREYFCTIWNFQRGVGGCGILARFSSGTVRFRPPGSFPFRDFRIPTVGNLEVSGLVRRVPHLDCRWLAHASCPFYCSCWYCCLPLVLDSLGTRFLPLDLAPFDSRGQCKVLLQLGPASWFRYLVRGALQCLAALLHRYVGRVFATADDPAARLFCLCGGCKRAFLRCPRRRLSRSQRDDLPRQRPIAHFERL